MAVRAVPGRAPRIDPDTWIDPAAEVIGDVTIEAGASVWPGAVRGDQDKVIFQMVTYGGMPVVVDALETFKAVLEERGEWTE